MNIKFPLNELLNLVNRAEQNGQIKEAVSLIETHIKELLPSEQTVAQSVKTYLQSKLPQTAAEVSARAQVEMSLQLNKAKQLFSRINKTTMLSEVKSKPIDRSEFSILKENINKNFGNMIDPRARDFWIENFINGTLDGMCGKDYDERFMFCAQRLVDLGVIDKSTLVITHTGHNIPIVHQLMQNKQLGDVSGVLEFSKESFPIMSDKVKNALWLFAKGEGQSVGLSSEHTAFVNAKMQPLLGRILNPEVGRQPLIDEYLTITEECFGRINDQNFTYPGTLNQTIKDSGTKFLGYDFHRTGKIDISKLPTANELKAAGIKKIVFIDELYPESIFGNIEMAQMYEPVTRQKVDIIEDLFDMFLSNMYQGKTEEGFRALFTLNSFVAPRNIRQKVHKPDMAMINNVKQKIQNSTFGHSIDSITRSDLASYAENLQKNDMPVFVEGADLYRLEHFPFDKLEETRNMLVGFERKDSEDITAISDLVLFLDRILP